MPCACNIATSSASECVGSLASMRGSRTEHVSACQRVWLYRAHRARDSRDVDDEAQRARAVRILVRSLYRDLVAQGFDDKQILAVAIELVGKVTEKLAGDTAERRRA